MKVILDYLDGADVITQVLIRGRGSEGAVGDVMTEAEIRDVGHQIRSQ